MSARLLRHRHEPGISGGAKRGKTELDIYLESWMESPQGPEQSLRARLVRLAGSFEGFGWLKAGFPEKGLDVGMDVKEDKPGWNWAGQGAWGSNELVGCNQRIKD